MAKTDSELLQECMQRFIELANTIKDEGIGINVVSSGLMAASGLYATYAMGGNEGTLTSKGIDKLSEVYKHQLEQIQQGKKQRSEKNASS
jgi:hypothetical protein